MLNFYCYLVGENPESVKTYQESSKKKIIVAGNLLMIPVLLWIVNGYLLSKEIFENSTNVSIFIGLFLGLIIFLLERSIIMFKSNKVKVINNFRMGIGFIVAILGSITLDEVLFKNDIDNIVNIMRKEKTDLDKESFDSEIKLQRIKVDSTKYRLDQLTENFQKEADGNGGSGRMGLGDIAKSKRDVMIREQKYYDNERSKLDSLEKFKSIAEKESKESFNDKGLLIRFKALIKLVSSDFLVLFIFLLYFILILLLESLVVLFKKYGEETIDEKLQGFREKLLEDKYKKYTFGQGGSMDIKNTEEMLTQATSLFKK